MGEGRLLINRTKALILALFAVHWVTVVAILVAALEVYDQAIRLPGGNQRPAEVGLLLVFTALFALLSTGVIRGWRWTFWLILVASLPGSAIERLIGKSPGRSWRCRR